MTTRYLLDEHLSPQIAEQLVTHGVDAVAVAAKPDLRGLPDPDILEAATSEGRVVVTRNIPDFVRLDALWGSAGRAHPGILCIAARRFPESPASVGTLTTALMRWAESGRDITGTHWFL